MLVLALESSAKAASVALMQDDALICQYSQCSGLTHSRKRRNADAFFIRRPSQALYGGYPNADTRKRAGTVSDSDKVNIGKYSI